MGLEENRKKIDEIDSQLVSLLEERLAVALAIGRYKKELGLAILDPKREAEVVRKNLERIQDQRYRPYVRRLMELLMSVSREAQRDIMVDRETRLEDVIGDLPVSSPVADPQVAYGGIQGSFGEEACLAYFGKEVRQQPYPTFREVIQALEEGKADYGVLPMENTSTGGILEVERLLEADGLFIVGEVVVPVVHCLLGLSTLEEISTVYSHVQGFEQSRSFLEGRGYREVPYFNTAISARYVAEAGDPSLGAIASRRAGEVYGLKVLAEGINDSKENFTRFVVVKKSMELAGVRDKISIQVILEDREGSLYKVVNSINRHQLSMGKIASRPILGKPFEYIFSIDFRGSLEDLEVKKALMEIRENALEMKFKGNYKAEKESAYGK